MDNVISRIIDIDYNRQIEVLGKFVSEESAEKRLLLVNSLIFLAADIIKSDGVIRRSEIQHVQDLLREILCEDEAKDAFTVLQQTLDTKVSSYGLDWQDDLMAHCDSLKNTMPEDVLLHILAFLYDLVKVDGVIDACEMVTLMGLTRLLGFNPTSTES